MTQSNEHAKRLFNQENKKLNNNDNASQNKPITDGYMQNLINYTSLKLTEKYKTYPILKGFSDEQIASFKFGPGEKVLADTSKIVREAAKFTDPKEERKYQEEQFALMPDTSKIIAASGELKSPYFRDDYGFLRHPDHMFIVPVTRGEALAMENYCIINNVPKDYNGSLKDIKGAEWQTVSSKKKKKQGLGISSSTTNNNQSKKPGILKTLSPRIMRSKSKHIQPNLTRDVQEVKVKKEIMDENAQAAQNEKIAKKQKQTTIAFGSHVPARDNNKQFR